MSSTRPLWSAFFIVLLASLFTSIVNAAPAAPVIVKTLTLQPFTQTLEALGTLHSNEAITLTATVTDTVRAVHFEDGQRVEANTILVEMTSDEEHAMLEEAQFALEEAERQYRRVQSLAKTNLTTEALLDQRLQAYQAAQSQLLAMQSRMSDRLILAPFAGVLGMRQISVGTLVKPGDTITTLDDDTSMKLDMSLPAVFLDAIRPGLKITAQSREIPGKAFTGEITAIDSRIDPNTRSVLVRARLANNLRELKSGMLMTVQLQKAPIDSLLLPEEALIQEGFRSYVYRLQHQGENTTVAKQEVQTGPRRLGEVVVSTGLNPGDQVVVHGVMRLKNGAAVTITAIQEHDETLETLLHKTTPTPSH